MKTRIVMLLVLLLMFLGCTKQPEESAPGEAAKEAVPKEAVEATKEAVPEEAAKAEVEDPDVKSCLELVSEAKFNDALPVCLEALKKHPDNDKVKVAVEKAQAGVGDAAAAAADAVEGAQEEAVGKTAGAMDEAAGSLPQ